ncbi:hypothetical protein B0O80DRAFT_458689 [Mortierella sp. GBAus27b]|nr:hypothetical protein B0O80DRAFT_458689 [Mortierella sp. GBAus27b]
MLEECVNHKQFEYGWKLYERMGSALEDKETTKVAMRLCRRAFLGHGGTGSNSPGSPNLMANDIQFGDDEWFTRQDSMENDDDHGGGDHSDDDDDNNNDNDDDDDNGNNSPWEDEEEDIPDSLDKTKHESGLLPILTYDTDPEIWEARAWVIYNKATMDPSFFCPASPSSSSSGSPPPSLSSPSPIQLPQHASSSSSSSSSSSCSSVAGCMVSAAGATSLAEFLHSILTVAINSPEKSSRFLKALKVYDHMRSDPLNQYEAQLRDPFVMTCMIKAIYDTVLAVTRVQHSEENHKDDRQPQERPQQQQQQPMTIGPLIDLAFEIYADMRNVGPIRHLPQLCSLAPPTPMPKSPRTPDMLPNHGGLDGGVSNHRTSSSMSMFFQLSSRQSAPHLPSVDLSAYSAHDLSAENLDSSTAAPSAAVSTSTTNMCVHLQPLSLALNAVYTGRRLPNELYLALLHLCVQVPLSGIQQSVQVVKTIVTDMMSTRSGQQPAHLDRHLAAALQVFHDQWLCRPQELKGRSRDEHHADQRRGSSSSSSKDTTCSGSEGCLFHGWMYRPDDHVQKYLTASNVFSESVVLSDPNGAGGMDKGFPGSESGSGSGSGSRPDSSSSRHSSSSSSNESSTSGMDQDNSNDDSPHYGISVHDAELDEIDQYLGERAAAAAEALNKNGGDEASVEWMDGLDHDTCNNRYYWDLWSRHDPVLRKVKFSRRRARMLWRHIGSLREGC